MFFNNKLRYYTEHFHSFKKVDWIDWFSRILVDFGNVLYNQDHRYLEDDVYEIWFNQQGRLILKRNFIVKQDRNQRKDKHKIFFVGLQNQKVLAFNYYQHLKLVSNFTFYLKL